MNRHTALLVAGLAIVPSACIAWPATSHSPSPSTSPGALAVITASPSIEPTASATPAPTATPTEAPSVAPNPAPAEGTSCGTGEAAFKRAVRDVDNGLAFGGRPIEFTTAGITMRNGSYAADDSIPGFIGLTSDEVAVESGSGGSVRLNGPPNLTLIRADARSWPWSSIDFANGSGGRDEDARPVVATPNGARAILVHAPMDAGDYALEFHVTWMTACLEGDGVAYARLFVR
jgi:hypothetical protein